MTTLYNILIGLGITIVTTTGIYLFRLLSELHKCLNGLFDDKE